MYECIEFRTRILQPLTKVPIFFLLPTENNYFPKETRIKLQSLSAATKISGSKITRNDTRTHVICLLILTKKAKKQQNISSVLKLSASSFVLDVNPGFFKMKSLLCLYLERQQSLLIELLCSQ